MRPDFAGITDPFGRRRVGGSTIVSRQRLATSQDETPKAAAAIPADTGQERAPDQRE